MLVALHSKFFKNIYSTWIKKSFCLEAWVSSPLSVMLLLWSSSCLGVFFLGAWHPGFESSLRWVVVCSTFPLKADPLTKKKKNLDKVKRWVSRSADLYDDEGFYQGGSRNVLWTTATHFKQFFWTARLPQVTTASGAPQPGFCMTYAMAKTTERYIWSLTLQFSRELQCNTSVCRKLIHCTRLL